MQTLKEFSQQHGISAIVRRHFDYVNPLSSMRTDSGAVGGFGGALGYARIIDPAQLGLSIKGGQDAFKQGCKLAEMGIVPAQIICGIGQRNYDGARFTAEGIKEIADIDVPVNTSSAVTYPYYKNAEQTAKAMEAHGDYAVHMNLAGRALACEGELWTEPPEAFEARIVVAVKASYGGMPLFDLNFEQLTLLYFLHLKRVSRQTIPYGEGVWVPTKGGGLVYGDQGTPVAEFTPDLEIVSESN